MREAALTAARRGHESSLLGAGRVAWFALALALLIGLTALVAVSLVGGFRLPRPAIHQLPQERSNQNPFVPQLQSAPAADLRAYRQTKEAALHTYRWIDKHADRLQIPIERAMQLLVERATRASRAAPPQELGQ